MCPIRTRADDRPYSSAKGETGHATPPRGGFAPQDRVPWAQLLHRVWLTQILVCAGCGGRRELVAQVTDPFAARKILEHLGLDPSTPGPVPARGPPEELRDAV